MEKISTNDPLPKGSIWAKIIKPYEDQLYAEEYIKIKVNDMEYLNKKENGPILEQAVDAEEIILMPTGMVLAGHFPIFSPVAKTENFKGIGKRLQSN